MEEKRLIDADDLLIAFGNALNNATLKIGYGFMEQVVNEQPTVDPESMRGHARWLKDENVKIIDTDAYGNTFESPAVYCENCNAALSEADFRGRCPRCGGKIIYSEFYQNARDYTIRKDGKVPKRYVSRSGELSESVAACENGCGAYWEDEDFSIGQDGMFYDNKYTEDGQA